MLKRYLPLSFLLCVLGLAQAQEPSDPASREQGAEPVAEPQLERAAAEAPAEEPGVKSMSGMSILGNEEAPKSLVIVPWKSSQIGDEVGVANAMDERARPVDKEVFMREVRYYELRSNLHETVQ